MPVEVVVCKLLLKIEVCHSRWSKVQRQGDLDGGDGEVLRGDQGGGGQAHPPHDPTVFRQTPHVLGLLCLTQGWRRSPGSSQDQRGRLCRRSPRGVFQCDIPSSQNSFLASGLRLEFHATLQRENVAMKARGNLIIIISFKLSFSHLSWLLCFLIKFI